MREGPEGHRTYDESAKRELIERCLEGKESIAKVSRAYGINANVLHNWIGRHRKEGGEIKSEGQMVASPTASAFIPVMTVPPKSDTRTLAIRFGNGIQADLAELSREDVLAILTVLSCSASTRP